MTADRLHPDDKVRVDLYLEGKDIGAYEGTGFHTVAEAIHTAFDSSGHTDANIENYVFRVTDLARNTTARYRINAGGNTKLIPEERF